MGALILFLLIACIFFAVGMGMLLTPKRKKKRCTLTVPGTVIGYYKGDAGGTDIDGDTINHDVGVRRPVTQYVVNGETYTAIGPYYTCISDTHEQKYPEEKGTVEFSNGVIHAHMVRDTWQVHKFNPYEQLFPPGTNVTVHYDSENPKFSYVNDLPEEKLPGRIFLLCAVGVIVVMVLVILSSLY